MRHPITVLLASVVLAACSASGMPESDVRVAFEQDMPGVLELEDFDLENKRNVGSEEEPVWVSRFTARIAPRVDTFEIDTVVDGVRILKPVRKAGEDITVYGTVRSVRRSGAWSHTFDAERNFGPALGNPREEYGADALVAGSPEAKALMDEVEAKRQKAAIEEEARIAAEAAESERRKEAEAAKRKRIEAAVAKYGAAFATRELGDMVPEGTSRRFLVTADASGNGAVWGTDGYTCDSNFARAVVHSGALDSGDTGVVEVSASPERQRGNFIGSPRNGVNSQNYSRNAYACRIRLLERIADQ